MMPLKRRAIHPALPLFYLLTGLLLAACSKPVSEDAPAYLDTELPLETRVDDLVSRMTVTEKIAQLYNEAPAIEHLGVAQYNWWNEALHGVARAGKATVFPQAIGMAAAFNPSLLHSVADAISDEARAKHHHFVDNDVVFRYTGLTFWSPNVNIFRDPRWGRGQETYGEDPFLTGTLAVEFIRGLQGDHPHYLKTSAQAKHFAVHSGPEESRHRDDYHASPKDLFETYLPAFEMAVKDARVDSVMCAYNRVNGDPACGSDYLLKDILRGEWEFTGHVVSDCGAIADFYDPSAHGLVQAPAEAAAWALLSGTDLNCGTGRLSTYANLHFALQRGMVTEADIDRAVKRLFTTRFKLGMFDSREQVPYANISMDVVGSEKHQLLNQQIAEQSLVLLKNDGLLPLTRDQRVAVIGPNAANPAILVANYHGDPIDPVLPLEGIQALLGTDKVSYAPGSALIAEKYGHYQTVPSSALFHRAGDGSLQPGLQAAYHRATLAEGIIGEPVLERIDPEIDFHWQRSPLDDRTLWDEFGVVWRGVLVPEADGTYQFESRAQLTLNGEQVEGKIALKAGQEYTLEATTRFVRAWWGNPLEPFVALTWVNTARDLASEALAAAEEADVVIFMGGISALLEGEEMAVELPGFFFGDRTRIDLPDEQQDLLRRLQATGKPIVLVNFSGSAMALNWEAENLNAIVQAFYPGERTGTALARMLWGEFSPSGRLPVTFYRGTEDLGELTDYAMENRTYKYYQGAPLYAFGHGLSYHDFHYSELQVPERIAAGDPLPLRVTLSSRSSPDNRSAIAAEEVTQVYVHMLDAPVRVPQRELVAFSRTTLEQGGTEVVALTVDPRQLRYVDDEGKHHPYRGRLNVSVGAGQPGSTPAHQVAETIVTIE